MQDITDQINSLKTHFDSKLDVIKKDFEINLSKELKSLMEHVELEVGKCTSKIESREARLTVLGAAQSEPFDPQCSVLIFNMEPVANENEQSLKDAITEIIDDGLGIKNVQLVCVERLPGRDDKTGIVKVQFGSKDLKVTVLRAKRALKKKPKYKSISIYGAQTHTERLNYLNARTILKELPHGDRYLINGSGRVVLKDDSGDGNDEQFQIVSSDMETGAGFIDPTLKQQRRHDVQGLQGSGVNNVIFTVVVLFFCCVLAYFVPFPGLAG